MNFAGKVVLITGASSGIGATTAIYFSRLGASLSLTGRNEAKLKETVNNCKKTNGSEPLYIPGDLSKEEDITRIFNETIKKYGQIDVLINNAGFGNVNTLETITTEQYDAVLNTNMRSVLLLTKLVMPHLIKTKGNIVNVSSTAGIRPAVGYLAYSISKAALDQFTKCVALEMAPKQVRVNSVNPGAVETDFATAFGLTDQINQNKLHNILGEIHPIGRIANASEVAQTIAFLASDLASDITGTLLPVDGGMSLTSATSAH